jgi:hypothetical protein
MATGQPGDMWHLRRHIDVDTNDIKINNQVGLAAGAYGGI